VNDQVRFGVLGCADIAWRRTIPAVLAHPCTALTCVASRDPARAGRFAERFGCRATDYAGLLASDDVDVVYAPLPPALRRWWGLAALDAGKHLLLEKPLATNEADARDLVRAARLNRRLVRENFMFLHHSQHGAVRRVVVDGRLGTLLGFDSAFCIPPLRPDNIRYRRDLGGGALLDVGVYPLRAAQLLLGPGLRVAGAALRVDPATGVDLAGRVTLVSADDVLASVAFGFEHAYGSHYMLWGSEARLHLDRAFTPPADHRPVLRVSGLDGDETIALEADDQFLRAVGAFAGAVLAGRTAASAAEERWCADAVETLRLTDEVRRGAVTVTAERACPNPDEFGESQRMLAALGSAPSFDSVPSVAAVAD
jgi:NDP-hexose-3-ketoreductase